MFKKVKNILKLILHYRLVKEIKIVVTIPCGTMVYCINDNKSGYVLHRADGNGDWLGGTISNGLLCPDHNKIVEEAYDTIQQILDDHAHIK